MAPARPATSRRLRTCALLVRKVSYGETDLVVTLFTEEAGTVAALARGGRRSVKRFASLEPVHLLRVDLDVVATRELAVLKETSIARPRFQLLTTLAALEAAGQALRWVRTLAPAMSAEPALWQEVNALLDALDAPGGAAHAEAMLAIAGLRFTYASGWALELSGCVSCGKRCPDGARVRVDVPVGGVVCQACGGGRGVVLSSRQRQALLASLAGSGFGLAEAVAASGAAVLALQLVEQTLLAHGEAGPTR